MAGGENTTFIIANQITIWAVVSVASSIAAICSCQVFHVCWNTKTPLYLCDRLTCREQRKNLPLREWPEIWERDWGGVWCQMHMKEEAQKDKLKQEENFAVYESLWTKCGIFTSHMARPPWWNKNFLGTRKPFEGLVIIQEAADWISHILSHSIPH